MVVLWGVPSASFVSGMYPVLKWVNVPSPGQVGLKGRETGCDVLLLC